MNTVPTSQADLPHPAWCAPTNCTALRGVHGSHRGENLTVMLTSYTLTLYIELGRTPARPLLIVEQRSCRCAECEPIAVLSLPVEAAKEFLAGVTGLVEDMGASPGRGGQHARGCMGDHIGPCPRPVASQ